MHRFNLAELDDMRRTIKKDWRQPTELTNFSGVPFPENATFHDTKFDRCLFRGTVFTNASFRDVTFYECDFGGASFENCTFDACIFIMCEFRGVDVENAKSKRLSRFISCTFEVGYTALRFASRMPVLREVEEARIDEYEDFFERTLVDQAKAS